jgi:hypothetical protein
MVQRVLRAYVTSTRLRLVEMRGFPLRAAGEPAELVVDEPAGEAPRWRAAAQALDAMLGSRKGARFDLDVLLGDESVRYALLPPSDVRMSTQELVGLATSVLQRTYGDALGGWVVRVTAAGRQSMLAAAIDPEQLRSLQESAGRAGGRLRSVVPAFIHALRARTLARRKAAWIVVREPAAAVLALLEGGEMRALRVHRSPIASGPDLAALLEREVRRIGSEVREIVVCGESAEGIELPAGWALSDEGRRDPLFGERRSSQSAGLAAQAGR